MVEHTSDLSIQEVQGRESQRFKVILGYILNLRPCLQNKGWRGRENRKGEESSKKREGKVGHSRNQLLRNSAGSCFRGTLENGLG